MIHESYYWKKELYNSFLTIAKFRNLKRTTEKSYVKVEKALLLGAYIIRKLDDAKKIPQNMLQTEVILEVAISNGTIVDHLNWHKIENHYDLEKISEVTKDWMFIVNQIIHSYTLIYSYDNSNKFDGFIINSDRTKKESLFFLTLKNLFTIFLTVSEGDMTSASWKRQLISKENVKPIFGEMKLEETVYNFPKEFNLEKVIFETMEGNIYVRSENE